MNPPVNKHLLDNINDLVKQMEIGPYPQPTITDGNGNPPTWSDGNGYPHDHLECAGCNDLASFRRADQKELEELRKAVRDATDKIVELQEQNAIYYKGWDEQISAGARLLTRVGELAKKVVNLTGAAADKGGGDPKGIAQPVSDSGEPTPSSSASSEASTSGTRAKGVPYVNQGPFYEKAYMQHELTGNGRCRFCDTSIDSLEWRSLCRGMRP